MTELPEFPDLDISSVVSTPGEKTDRPIEEIYADLNEISRMLKESALKIESGNGSLDFNVVNNVSIKSSNTALKVIGNGNIKIKGEAQTDKYIMSLLKDRGDGDVKNYWILCNKTNPNQNISIHIKAKATSSEGGTTWETINDDKTELVFLNNGWNIIKIEVGGWVV